MKKALFFSLLPALILLLATSSVLDKNVGKSNPVAAVEPASEIPPATISDEFSEENFDFDEPSGEVSFKDFLKKFPKKSLPCAVNSYQLLNKLKKAVARDEDFERPKNTLSYEFTEFLPQANRAMMSRIPQYIVPLMAFENENFHTVVYSISRGYSEMYHSEFIATFDKNGKYRGTHEFSSYAPDKIVAVSLDKNLQIVSKIYDVKWKLDTEKEGYEKNEISGLTFLEEKTIDATEVVEPDQKFRKRNLKKEVPVEKEKTVKAK